MDSHAPDIPLIPSVSLLAPDYDVWLCDIWGVLHNGLQPFPSACDACRRFRAQGGCVVLISNSPRPRDGVIRQMLEIGVPEDAWDAVATSGDVTRDLIARNVDKAMLHIGPQRDLGIFEGHDIRFAGPAEAEIIVCSGLHDDTSETPEDYLPLLRDLAGRGLVMICANPDLMVERGHRLVYCAGALAAEYEKLGGRVLYAGKPHRPIYDLALALAQKARGEAADRRRILAIGDGLKTDMAGAAAAGLDALYIASGLHLSEAGSNGTATREQIAELFSDQPMRPVAAQVRLAW
ncbi:MAG: TIGR01459 family HAD-type hydrolase [Methyloligellaceae bacterium]